jgi:hypothetical protein
MLRSISCSLALGLAMGESLTESLSVAPLGELELLAQVSNLGVVLRLLSDPLVEPLHGSVERLPVLPGTRRRQGGRARALLAS